MRYPERLSFLARRRGLVPRLVCTAYVVAAVLRVEGGQGLRAWGTGALALALSAASAGRERRASSLALWGASLALASLGTSSPPSATVWIDVLGMIGTLVAAVASVAALAELRARATRRGRYPWAAVASLSLAWGSAVTVAALSTFDGGAWFAEYRGAWAVAAALVSGAILVVSCVAALAFGALVLDIADRARVARGVAGSVLVLAGAVSVVDSGGVDRALRAGVAAASALVALVALHGDTVRVVRAWRRVTVLVVFGGPVALLAAMTANGRPWDGPSVVFTAAVVALLIGSAAPFLELPLRPLQGAWLDAIEKARGALASSEADTAIREAMAALRAPAGPAASSPELWTLDPVHVLTIDAAGYAHERPAELPDLLLSVAAAEPEATLRSEVLVALEVRRPDLRSLSSWMEDRGALSATVIASSGEPRGALVLPRGRRVSPMTLEEVHAIKQLADVLAGACEARSALFRSLAREREAAGRAETAEERVLRFEQARALDAERHALATSRLARPATVGVYSVASRLALEALERRILADAPVAVVAPSGVDPVPYLARAHLGGPRRAEPFVQVDGTSSREHDLDRWRDPRSSPLALADRGLLVLLDGPSLPAEVQRLVGEVLAERRPPWERPDPLDIALALTAAAPPASLRDDGRLDHALAARLGDACEAPIVLPRLSERPEDIRAILTDRLAREGLRVRGTPVGIDDAAFARLSEYPFPGEDAELGSMVQRLVLSLRGDVVRRADVEALELAVPAPRESARGLRGAP